ncbi:Ribosomal RNA processing protein 1-like protein A [Trichoplax sp. H2]|nr:Ribosomal RNA processing protein 1-like protein A [Trichoplax sp. H2]|eukprot:RDD46682.1 Ribosomal RNA processing protein 1-like protein A [Trichoplax sp. H2]
MSCSIVDQRLTGTSWRNLQLVACTMASKEIILFAKRLASNEKKIRDRSVRRLRLWLQKRSKEIDFDEIEILKLWRGLFYCMWMSDKPLIQEELADMLASLLFCFEDVKKWSLFLSSFYNTMCREWIGIDRLRMDKFYMLMKKMMKQSLVGLLTKDWDESWVKALITVLSDGPIHPTEFKVLDGIRLYITEIFLDELLSLDLSKISCDQVVDLLKPFVTLSAEACNHSILNTIDENIYQRLLEEDIKSKLSNYQDLYSTLEKILFESGSKKEVKPRNRKILYNGSKRFREAKAASIAHDNPSNATEQILEESSSEDIKTENNLNFSKEIIEPTQVNETDDTAGNVSNTKRKKKKEEAPTTGAKKKKVKKTEVRVGSDTDKQIKPEVLHQQDDEVKDVKMTKRPRKVKTDSNPLIAKAKSLIKFKPKKSPAGTALKLSSGKKKELEKKGNAQKKKSRTPSPSSGKKVRIMLKKNKTQEFHKDEPAINVSPFRTFNMQTRSKAENFF